MVTTFNFKHYQFVKHEFKNETLIVVDVNVNVLFLFKNSGSVAVRNS